MKTVDAGTGRVPLISLIAILSVSLVVNLPGLAIAPLQAKLDTVFHHVSDLEIQLLQVLPNFVIIPFILLAGKIATRRTQVGVLALGLILYAIAGGLCLLARSMTALIVLSCLLGVGCGLVIPLAASLISQNFKGKARSRTLGWKSGLSNGIVIFATIFVGWVAAIRWELAFLVYLVPLIPLALIFFVRNRFLRPNEVVGPDPKGVPDPDAAPPCPPALKDHCHDEPPKHMPWLTRAVILMIGLMALYIIATYSAMGISYYIPFTMQNYGFSSGASGVAIAMFYLSASLGGFFLQIFKRWFGHYTIRTAFTMMVVGFFALSLFHHPAAYDVSIFVVGLGYGIIQPIIYDKTSYIAPNENASTRYFSYLLTGNYIGIAVAPFIVSGLASLMHQNPEMNFTYVLNGCILAAVLVWAWAKHKSFLFDIDMNDA